ncbi:triple tyrosine motif-containing protein [Oscillatoria amoena NRMC-F 0135]|nr:triple tyrosine motif-containing protein [Oscillatoria amoena NRMC-F 0135]
MAMTWRLSVFAVLLSVAARAQNGSYFLSHFSPDQDRFSPMCYDMVQDKRGLFYFATQRGVLRFDGRTWDQIRTSGAAYSLELVGEDVLYVAGSKGFGKITLSDKGLEYYQPLYEKPDAAFTFQVCIVEDQVYFLNERNLYRYAGDSVTQIAAPTGASLMVLSEVFGNVLVSSEEETTGTLVNNQIQPFNLFKSDSLTLLFAERFGDTYLLGTSDSRLYVCGKNLRPREIVLSDAAYASASVIVSAAWVRADLVALGTLRGGVLFVNPKTGVTEQIINYSTGLPDNEIYTLYCDRNQNIWAAHAYGFTRIAPFLPFRSFRQYQGLQGNLLCARSHKGKVYVGTSLGLYSLEREDFYEELIYYVNVPLKQTTRRKSAATPVAAEQETKEKGGIFGFLRKKKTSQSTAPSKESSATPTTQTAVRYKREKRVKRILRSSHYVYKRINEVDAKVTDLSIWKGKLIASGLSGAFEVDGTSVRPIIEDPVRFLFASNNLSTIIVSTYDDKLHRIGLVKNIWQEQDLINSIDNPVSYIFEEPGEAIWLCGLDKAYRLPIKGDQQPEAIDFGFTEYDRVLGIAYKEQVLFATSSGFYRFEKQARQLVREDSLERPQSFFSGGNTLWFRDEHNWYALGNAVDQQRIRLLNLLQDVRFITSDYPGENLWIISGNDELVYFNTNRILQYETTYPLLLKWIEQNNSTLTRASFLRLDQDNNSVRIEVAKPDYFSGHAVEYRYMMQGLNEDWSAWSVSNNRIDFPFLPPGDYSLAVQSKDIFGRIADMEPVRIRVLPPYWKRSWFYALEFGVFTLLVFASFRLSNRYRFVSRVLSLLSIIILIEFIQTIAGSTFATEGGPVVEFAIQVGIAFVILPVEGFLRRFMLRSIEKGMME